MMRTSDFLRRQAELCLAISRATFDLTMAGRLRTMAAEFNIKATELDDDATFLPRMLPATGTSGRDRD
jgi:hypothetical protein